jgi:hypothetical protein
VDPIGEPPCTLAWFVSTSATSIFWDAGERLGRCQIGDLPSCAREEGRKWLKQPSWTDAAHIDLRRSAGSSAGSSSPPSSPLPAYFIGYAKMLDNPSLITGNGADPTTGIATGAPRAMTWLGLIGGPLVMITGILVMYNAIERGGAVQTIATLPEALWELSLSIYCIVKGFRLSSPILRMETVVRLPESESALRHDA